MSDNSLGPASTAKTDILTAPSFSHVWSTSEIDKNAKFFLMFSFHLVHYTLIVSQSKTYDRKQSTGKMQAVGKVNLAST